MGGRASDLIIASRRRLVRDVQEPAARRGGDEAEGGCGVIGLAAAHPVRGRHAAAAAAQMHNRGNGKGGGLAAAGLSPAQMRVSAEVLSEATLLQMAYLDPAARGEAERDWLQPRFEVVQGYRVPTLDDWRAVPGLEATPPEVWRYFLRARPAALERFVDEHGLHPLSPRQAEDEFVYQAGVRLNQRFYASLGEKRAFVLCQGRDLVVFKIVGYAEQAAAYYRLDEVLAHVWIAHQRYPTRGRVWHPAGAHPFVGLNEALVHNGDLANYYGLTTYLRQRNIVPLFLTDTEVSALLFDLLDRVYGYPLEATIEALAPTTEGDLERLDAEKQRLYRAIQATHLHASPDGPWFFIIARSLVSAHDAGRWELLGITDTSMLRPQVFALQEGKVQIGLIASEKQAIDAALESLAAEDERVCPVADLYWNARGGSHTDGGAFVFRVERHGPEHTLTVTDKFGRRLTTPADQVHNNPSTATVVARDLPWMVAPPSEWRVGTEPAAADGEAAWSALRGAVRDWDYGELTGYCQALVESAAAGDDAWGLALELLTHLRDRSYDPGAKRRASLVALVDRSLGRLLRQVPALPAPGEHRRRRLDGTTRHELRPPRPGEQLLVLDVNGLPAEGDESAARLIVQAVHLGWKRLVTIGWRGARFCGCGLGDGSQGVRIDVYGSSGDYLGSGLQGAEVHVHGSAQDQVGQILKEGRLVIHGDVGQTFLYGAKGGEAYVLGNAAGRPLINGVGRPRVVINGTCLDYLAESFMAGDPLHGGGFVIVNGVTFDAHGRLVAQPTPYPGGNLLSLASGGAVYVRDPRRQLAEDQLNGGVLAPLAPADWALIRPYLEENERLFGLEVESLLTVDGEVRPPEEVYLKVAVQPRGVPS